MRMFKFNPALQQSKKNYTSYVRYFHKKLPKCLNFGKIVLLESFEPKLFDQLCRLVSSQRLSVREMYVVECRTSANDSSNIDYRFVRRALKILSSAHAHAGIDHHRTIVLPLTRTKKAKRVTLKMILNFKV